MFKVVKRDGEVADFDLQKIGCAIEKAFDATQMQYNKDMVDLLNLRVTADFQKKIEDDKIDVESIQDSVENVLVQAGYADVAKAYILYRKQREKIRNMKSTILDYKEIVDSYVGSTSFQSLCKQFNKFLSDFDRRRKQCCICVCHCADDLPYQKYNCK